MVSRELAGRNVNRWGPAMNEHRGQLPFVAESIEAARARFAAALERVYPTNVLSEDRPGQKRENVFDFASGLRLIISRDRFEDGSVEIHVSASTGDRSDLAEEIREGLKPSTFRDGYVLTTLEAIAGARVKLRRQTMTRKGILHWVAEIGEPTDADG